MTLNYPAPYQVVIEYTTTPPGFQTMSHKLSLNLAEIDVPASVGDPFSAWTFVTRGGTSVTLQAAIDALVAGILPFYPAASDFITATLYEYELASYEANWLSVYAIGLSGTSANPSNPAHQTTWTHRTNQGGIQRFQLMETVNTGKTKQALPAGSAPVDAITDYLTGLTSPFCGQDGGYLVAGNYLSQSENEKLARKRYRT